MATIFEDDFNSYTENENLHGQGSWSGDASYKVQDDVVKEGTNAVENGSTVNDREIFKTGTARNDGRITVYMRRSSVSSGRAYLFLYEDTTLVGFFMFRDDYFKAIFDSGWDTFGTVVANQWHEVEIEWRSSDHNIRYRVDGGDWQGWGLAANTWSTGLDRVGFAVYGQASGQYSYWDYIAEEPLPPSVDTGNFFNLF